MPLGCGLLQTSMWVRAEGGERGEPAMATNGDDEFEEATQGQELWV